MTRLSELVGSLGFASPRIRLRRASGVLALALGSLPGHNASSRFLRDCSGLPHAFGDRRRALDDGAGPTSAARRRCTSPNWIRDAQSPRYVTANGTAVAGYLGLRGLRRYSEFNSTCCGFRRHRGQRVAADNRAVVSAIIKYVENALCGTCFYMSKTSEKMPMSDSTPCGEHGIWF